MKEQIHVSLGKDGGRRPGQMRKSFKPRQSVIGGLLAAAVARRDSLGLGVMEEDEGDEGEVY
jgi:hypothetical protein